MSKNIVLIGYMASGKSVIGTILAQKLSLKFIDLDAYIATKIKLSIPLIFEEKGEIFFRKIERQYLKEILEAETACVLAVGGGTPCYGDNMLLINKHAKSIFLKTPLNLLVDRLKNGKKNRPLVAHLNDEKLTEFVAKHLFERNSYYEQSAISIDATRDYSPRRIVELIYRVLNP